MALQQTHARLQQEQEMSANGSVAVFKFKNQEKWPVEYASPNVADLLGYTAEMFMRGKISYADIIHSEDINRVTNEVAVASQSQNERFEHLPYRLLRPDGTSLWVLDHTTIIRDKTGKATHYVGYLIDITARKEIEDSLRESEKRLALVLEGTALGTWDWDIPTGGVIFNARWAEMLGYQLSEIEPNVSSWEELMHPDEVADVMAILTDHLEGRTPMYQTEYRLRSKTGEWVWVLDSGKVFARDSAGNPIRVAGTHMDITARKQMEEQIVQHERMAAVGQLSAGIAHDFNNILASILLYTDLLQRQPDLAEDVKRKLAVITTSGQRAAKLVRQILDFSQKTVRRPEKIDLILFLQNSVEFLIATLPENIHIDLQINAGDYTAMVDPSQLLQAITNLAINAHQAMPVGGTLKIKMSRRIDENTDRCAMCGRLITGSWIRIEVADSGRGIPADILPSIFEPFFTTKEIGEGTGLGLSQVSGIMAQHDGHICVKSSVGQGSAFILYLPLVTATDEVAKDGADEAVVSQIKYGHGETILLVEDDETAADAVTAGFHYLGYQTIVATNGKEALALYEGSQTRINLVLSDIAMPEMDGVELFHRLRAKNPYISVILMSDHSLDDEGKVLLEKGVVAWLSKPVSLDTLSQAVSKALLPEKRRWT